MPGSAAGGNVKATEGSARNRLVRLGGTVLGSRPVSFACSRAVPGLRVLAYHDVPDPDAFRRHLTEIRRHYRPVGADEVVAAATTGRRLPRRALWVTFDDGHLSTLRAAGDLAAAGVAATCFVCPSVINGREPLWWQTVDEAIQRDVVPAAVHDGDVTRFRASLKTRDDGARRHAVDACRTALEATSPGGLRRQERQATTGDLEAWVGSGHHVGNHTWDHPLLDRCTESEQERQIVMAHDWLKDHLPSQPAVFAYPNGNLTPYAEKVAATLGYHVRVLFDHRVAGRPDPGKALSRLRIDSDAAPARFRAIASGAHPLAFAARRTR